MLREDFIKILKRIAGTELDEGEVYDEAFIGNEINKAADEYATVVKDRDRIRQQYIDDFTNSAEVPVVEEEKEEEKKEIQLDDFLNL